MGHLSSNFPKSSKCRWLGKGFANLDAIVGTSSNHEHLDEINLGLEESSS
jgi:hypothetical protein